MTADDFAECSYLRDTLDCEFRDRNQLVAAETAGPRRIQMKGDARAQHFDSAYLAVFNQKRFGKENARRTVESREGMGPSVGQDTGIDRTLIDDAVRPHDTALLVDNRIAAPVNALDNEIVTELELGHAIHRESVNGARRKIRPRRRTCRQ